MPVTDKERSVRKSPVGATARSLVAAVAVALAAAGCAGRPGAQGSAIASFGASAGAPRPRVGQSAVWTGTRMLVWGGQLVRGAAYRADGAAYDAADGRWTPIPAAPLAPRSEHVAVWTGSRMLVWGGAVQGQNVAPTSFADGASYDPAAGRWTAIAASPLEPRALAAAVWTGSRMLVWGGVTVGGTVSSQLANLRALAGGGSSKIDDEGGTAHADGAAYDPSSNTWSPLAASPLAARSDPVAVWTGRELLVWGGATTAETGAAFNDGAAYDPSSNTWRSIRPAPVSPGARYVGAWTGTRMLVWGGQHAEAAAYDPATNRWVRLPRSPLSFIPQPTAVWTGRVMAVWGQQERDEQAGRRTAASAAFDPERGTWSPAVSVPGGPSDGQTAVWNGERMLVWGGFLEGGSLASGATVDPESFAR